jgi:hypothetical protein
MKRFTLLVAVLLFPAHTTAADLSKIDRTVVKEPRYQSKPGYCLVVFGQRASTRVWLVLDGDDLYVDRNGNGDLTEPQKKVHRGKGQDQVPGVFSCGDIADRDGLMVYHGLTVIGTAQEGEMFVTVDVDGKFVESASVDGNGYLTFADTPSAAPIVHFNGPLTMGLTPQTEVTVSYTFGKKPSEGVLSRRVRVLLPSFVPGDVKSELRVSVGTPGLGNGTFARIHHNRVAAGIQPVAEVEFPNKAPSEGAMKIKTPLPNRC